MLAHVRTNPDVQYVEHNQIARASQSCSIQRDATWVRLGFALLKDQR
jgi:hypothetical protein